MVWAPWFEHTGMTGFSENQFVVELQNHSRNKQEQLSVPPQPDFQKVFPQLAKPESIRPIDLLSKILQQTTGHTQTD